MLWEKFANYHCGMLKDACYFFSRNCMLYALLQKKDERFICTMPEWKLSETWKSSVHIVDMIRIVCKWKWHGIKRKKLSAHSCTHNGGSDTGGSGCGHQRVGVCAAGEGERVEQPVATVKLWQCAVVIAVEVVVAASAVWVTVEPAIAWVEGLSGR